MKSHLSRAACPLYAALVIMLAGAPAAASVVNGGFETGDLSGWDSIGIADAVDDAIGVSPAGGSYHALMETNQGGFIGVAQSPAAAEDVNAFLSLPDDTLANLTADDVTQGSAIRQTVSLAAGQWVAFDWNFLTDESLESDFNDFAFVTLVNASTSAVVLADTFSPAFGPSTSTYTFETGYQAFDLPPVGASGDYVLGFGVLDATDFSLSSGLLVDDVTIIPEPGSAALLAVATAAMLRRRRARASLA